MNGGRTKTVELPRSPSTVARQIGPPLFYRILEQLGIDQNTFDRLR